MTRESRELCKKVVDQLGWTNLMPPAAWNRTGFRPVEGAMDDGAAAQRSSTIVRVKTAS